MIKVKEQQQHNGCPLIPMCVFKMENAQKTTATSYMALEDKQPHLNNLSSGQGAATSCIQIT